MIAEIITSTDKLQELDHKLRDISLVAIDTETDGLSRFRKVVGISLALSPDEGYYIPILIWDKEKSLLKSPWKNPTFVDNIIKGWLSDKNKKWIGHNIQFDIIALNNDFGINIEDNVFSDTILLHHTCISEDPPHGLKPLAARFIDPNAESFQYDLKNSVIENGGIWKMYEKEMYKGDFKILGKYAIFDSIFTRKLHDLWYPEIQKQGMSELWFKEVLPLIPVMVELNTTGIKVDIPYFEDLKIKLAKRIKECEEEIYSQEKEKIYSYEIKKIIDKVTITPRSEIGKLLIPDGLTFTETEEEVEGKAKKRKIYTPINPEKHHEKLYSWYIKKNEIDRVFSLNSSDDKAFLLFEVMGLYSEKKTKSGKASVDAETIEKLLEELQKDLDEKTAPKTLKLILERAKETKLLNTYVIPLLEMNIAGRVYPNFNQTGTSSGRFTSDSPFNFQTLPSGDTRIKKGLVPDSGKVLVASDWSAIEPRIFSHMSGEPELIKVYKDGLDFYSKVYIMLFNATEYSAKEGDANYLKKLNPKVRQDTKEYALGFVYGMSEYKLAKILNIEVEEAKVYKDVYFNTFQKLRNYMESCKRSIKYKNYVTSIVGRKRRAKVISFLQKEYRINVEDYKSVMAVFDRCMVNPRFTNILETLDKKHKKPKNGKDLNRIVRNEFNNGFNFPVQSLASSTMNRTCIELLRDLRSKKLDAKLVLTIYDEIILLVGKEHSEEVAKLLKSHMEGNSIAKILSVPLEANPIVTELSMAETK